MSKHTRLLDREPSAIICVDGNEKKIYNGNFVFLNDGDNFQIRLFNPCSEKIGIEILFNGQKKNDGLLVLKPGEDITLDRFLGEKKKMRYETYLIDGNNKSAVEAAALNGLVEFKFYKEKNYNHVYYSSSTGTLHTGLPHFTNSSTSDYNCSSNYKSVSRSYCSSGNKYKSPGVFTQDLDKSDNIAYSEYVAENLDKNIGYSEYVAENKVETGRIEKGPESNQNLTKVDVEFESNPFHVITYQLKPNSHKPVEIVEIRNYCVKCGYRLRKNNWKYCPSCGTKTE
jgi:hypothetical protein